MPPTRTQTPDFSHLRPRRTTLTVIIVLAVAYAVQMIATRAGLPVVEWLGLVPERFLFGGRLWQVVTTWFLHSSGSVSHLLGNCFMIWIFGNQLEGIYGRRDYLRIMGWTGLGGALLTVLVGGLSFLLLRNTPLNDWAYMFVGPTIGASGIATGLVMTWAGLNWNRKVHLFLMGEVSGKAVGIVVLIIEMLSALSYSVDSWTSHLGGAAVGYLIGRSLLSPRWLTKAFARRKHKKTADRLRKKKSKFTVIDGGRDDDDDTAGPPIWGGKGGPTIH